jgi:tetratricopeptide (TPR) repeat protein
MGNLSRVHLLLQQHRYDLAERELRGILVEDPDLAEPHSLLAICIMQDEARLKEATDEAELAVGLEPDEPFGHYTLGHVWLARNRINEARQSAQLAIALDPYSAEYFGLLAKIELSNRSWQAALDAATSGLSVDPENSGCSHVRSIALERLGRSNEAVQSAREELSRSPESTMAHTSLGWAALRSGNYQQAQESFREALRLDPSNEMARDGMIDALNSRSFVFRTVSRFHTWLSRFAAKYQFAMILGAWFVIQFLDSLGRKNPALAVITFPLIILYNLMVLLTLIATPLFNTFLRFNHFGRHLLKRREIWASNLIAVCLITSLVSGVYVYALGGNGLLYAGYWLLMLIPVSTTLQQVTTKRLVGFAIASLIIALIPVYGMVQCMNEGSWASMSSYVSRFAWSIFGLQIASNFVHQMPVRR